MDHVNNTISRQIFCITVIIRVISVKKMVFDAKADNSLQKKWLENVIIVYSKEVIHFCTDI